MKKGVLYDKECRRIGGEEDRDRFERGEGKQYVFVGIGGIIGEEDGLSGEAISMVRGLMMMGDYENLLKVFDHHFGEFVILYR
tara:strand:- start:1658 stop:1906 length:249 start_codon:yes stop_codon:yes gene_type:complete